MRMLDFLFPKKCVDCGGWGEYICTECVNRMEQIAEPICPMCARKSIGGVTHAKCERKMGMDGLVASVKYRGVARRMIGKFKYRHVSELVSELVELVLSWGALENLPDQEWVVVGVPLHGRRERWRGFNQAGVLGEKLATELGCGYEQKVLVREKYTSSQMKLKRNERMKNVVGAFGKGENISKVSGRWILLVDDVWTTGATMRECSKVLKRGGARGVWGLVVAR